MNDLNEKIITELKKMNEINSQIWLIQKNNLEFQYLKYKNEQKNQVSIIDSKIEKLQSKKKN